MEEQKIPMIIPNEQGNKVVNKEKIMKFLENETNGQKIEQYIEHNARVLKNHPQYKIDDVIEIMEYSNYKVNKIKGIDRVTAIVNETKKEVSNLNNVEVIYCPYYMNDKNKNGFRYDVTYIKIKDELYEVRDVNKVVSFLGNKEIIKNLKEEDIIKFIKEYSSLIKKNYLNYEQGTITLEKVEKEINNESDMRIRDALLAHKDDVVKEREKLLEYLNQNNLSLIVKYGINSNEERIYFVGDKIIRFVDKERRMQILDSKEMPALKHGEFEKQDGYQNNYDVNEYKELSDFIVKEQMLENIIEKLYNEEQLTDEELNMLTSFLELYMDAKENNIEVNEKFDSIVAKWYENSSIDEKFPNKKFEELYERTKAYRKDRIKTYKPDKFDINNAAFISTFALLEGSLLIGLITALIMLFK